MNLSHFAPSSYTKDASWIDNYIASMGEDKFWKYTQKVTDLLNKLEVGQSLAVVDWVQPERYELFVKIACFYVSESNCNYQINKEYNLIKHTFDAREMERTSELFKRQRENKIAERDGGGTEPSTQGTETIPAQPPTLQDRE